MKYDSDKEWRERSFRLACELFDYCDEIGQRPGPARRLSYQLFDAGSSIGANLAESQSSYTRKELGSKDAIALKESKETKFWLRIADAKLSASCLLPPLGPL